MIVKKNEKEHFIYIFYKRETFEDFTHLKQMMEKCLCKQTDKRDIIIDFTLCSIVTTAEIELLVTMLKKIIEASRCLRVIAGAVSFKKIRSTNFLRSPQFIAYKDHNTFFREYIYAKNCKGSSE